MGVCSSHEGRPYDRTVSRRSVVTNSTNSSENSQGAASCSDARHAKDHPVSEDHGDMQWRCGKQPPMPDHLKF